jgi:glycerophosphoryl diester phosphodiesterase
MRLPLPVVPGRPAAAAPSTPDSPAPGRPLTIAHRGASAAAPENTLAAVRRAVADGADAVEIDVQRTRDGALVVLHDATLERTTNVRELFPERGPWAVADFDLAEVRRLDAGSWRSPEHAGEQVPTLREVTDLLRGTGVGLQLELKLPGLYPGVVADLAHELQLTWEVWESPAVAGRFAVQSFDFLAMKELKARLPRVPVGLLGRPARANLPVLASWADQVNPSHLGADAGYLQAVQAAGLRTMVWTVDQPWAMRRACRLGVDGVITNRPADLRSLLEPHPAGGR